MLRTRLVLPLVVVAASIAVSACGEEEQMGPAGAGINSAGTRASLVDEFSVDESGLGLQRSRPGSGVARDTSIVDSVESNYGGVPGAMSIDDASFNPAGDTDLGSTDDGLTDSAAADGIEAAIDSFEEQVGDACDTSSELGLDASEGSVVDEVLAEDEGAIDESEINDGLDLDLDAVSPVC